MEYRHPVPAGADSVRAAAQTLAARLPEPLRPLAGVAYNYRWSWDPDGPAVFQAIDPERWAAVSCNPVRQLVEASPAAREAAAADTALTERVTALARRLEEDLDRPAVGGDPSRPAAFLCSEYGVHPSLPLYAGGLGILAGDILKESSDLALPMVGVGLRYRSGYFHQRLDASGWQHEWWVDTDPYLAATVPVAGGDGQPLEVSVPIYGRDVRARIWRVDIGRVPLFLLDANVPANSPFDRWITGRLYDANPEIRLAQYALLGIGAVRALKALGIDPALLHLNEGHPALAPLELIAGHVTEGMSFEDAAEAVRRRCVFTTHTPVPAGNETYPVHRFEAALGDLHERIGLDRQGLLALARTRPDDGHDEPGMTPIALRLACSTNGVSRRHGEVARGMWNVLFPGPVDEVPITHVTNGVHVPTWTGDAFATLFDRYLGDGWRERAGDPATWEAVDDIPDDELWRARRQARSDLVDWATERVAEDRVRRGVPLLNIERAAAVLDPDVLTLGFARRVATYKRLYLLGMDVERAVRLLADPEPVQMLLAGKAHPADDAAKGIVRDLFHHRGLSEIVSRVAYLEDYDMDLGARLTAGCDIWLNVPRPPLEASGTSGMKSVLNGGLNLSVLDGWWAEGYDGANGWGLSGDESGDHGHQDREHADALFDVLEKQVVPLFHDRDEHGIPRGWVARMRASLKTCAWQFSATRMMTDYRDRIYPSAR